MTARRPHALWPEADHDVRARFEFVGALRGQLARTLMPGMRSLFERRVAPALAAGPMTRRDDFRAIRPLMEAQPPYQFWSALQRRSQELAWEAAIDATEPALEHLIDAARGLAARTRGTAGGSLELDPSLPVPRYHTAADIHLQPGGYHTEFAPGDVAAGALYDQVLRVYSNGNTGPLNEVFAERLLAFQREHWPDLQPRRVLDLGCGIGNSTLPWARAFPQARVEGIDVAAPQLRYAHARAESLGVPAHFSQRNAESTGFPAGSFDLVVSHIMLHETSRSALPAILRECRRLLAPGGLMLHLEIPRGRDPYEKFIFNWEAWNNNETFAVFLTDLDLAALAVDCGFEASSTRCVEFAVARPPEQRLYSEAAWWKVLGARA